MERGTGQVQIQETLRQVAVSSRVESRCCEAKWREAIVSSEVKFVLWMEL